MSDDNKQQMAPSRVQRGEHGRLLPGSVLNPNGRPKGSRHKLEEMFLEALAADFKEHGIAAIIEMRTKDPATYARVIASILPKEMTLDAGGGLIALLGQLEQRRIEERPAPVAEVEDSGASTVRH